MSPEVLTLAVGQAMRGKHVALVFRDFIAAEKIFRLVTSILNPKFVSVKLTERTVRFLPNDGRLYFFPASVSKIKYQGREFHSVLYDELAEVDPLTRAELSSRIRK